MENKKILVSADEQSAVSRSLLLWFRTMPNKPFAKLNYEYLGPEPGYALSTIQSAYKVRQYITGGYRAQYQFKVVCRVLPSNDDERLDAEEVTNAIGAWAEDNASSLDIGDSARVLSLDRDTVAALYARYEGGLEDYQILMTLNYEVNV